MTWLERSLLFVKYAASLFSLYYGVYAIRHDFKSSADPTRLNAKGRRGIVYLIAAAALALFAEVGRDQLAANQAVASARQARTDQERAAKILADMLDLQSRTVAATQGVRDSLEQQRLAVAELGRNLGRAITRFENAELMVQFAIDSLNALPGNDVGRQYVGSGIGAVRQPNRDEFNREQASESEMVGNGVITFTLYIYASPDRPRANGSYTPRCTATKRASWPRFKERQPAIRFAPGLLAGSDVWLETTLPLDSMYWDGSTRRLLSDAGRSVRGHSMFYRQARVEFETDRVRSTSDLEGACLLATIEWDRPWSDRTSQRMPNEHFVVRPLVVNMRLQGRNFWISKFDYVGANEVGVAVFRVGDFYY